MLRPYLPDDTPITTSLEEQQLRKQEKQLRETAEEMVAEESSRRREAEARAAEAIQRHADEVKHRQEIEAELERLRDNSMRTTIGPLNKSIAHRTSFEGTTCLSVLFPIFYNNKRGYMKVSLLIG